MDVSDVLRFLPRRARSALLDWVNDTETLRLWLSKRIINRYAYSAPIRPRPHSMAAEYVTWRGLTDRRFSGRHLPVAKGETEPATPPLEEVVALFRRDVFKPAEDTSLLFPFFAQWFTDGFLRTKWEDDVPRRFRENESNHEIDLNQIYGATEVQTSMLRDPADRALLRTQEIGGEIWPGPLFEAREEGMALRPEFERRAEQGETEAVPGLYSPVNFRRVYEGWSDEDKRHAFAVGLEHGNSTLGQSAMNALWVREHNRTARILREAHPDWDAERVFQTARNVTIVCLLNIVIGDYIVHIAPLSLKLEARPGMAEQERWYRTNHIPVEFALLYRWHDLIPDRFDFDGVSVEGDGFRRANAKLVKAGLGRTLRDASKTRAGRFGLFNTAPFLLQPRSQGGPDVKRLSLEMARACRLPSFNAYRRHYGLTPYESFEALTRDPETAARLRALYGEVERLEWFVGLFAEGYGPGEMMGELMTTMVANDAFTQALTNPLLAEAVYNERTFSPEGFDIVRETKTLAQVIARNTEVEAEAVSFEIPRSETA